MSVPTRSQPCSNLDLETAMLDVADELGASRDRIRALHLQHAPRLADERALLREHIDLIDGFEVLAVARDILRRRRRRAA